MLAAGFIVSALLIKYLNGTDIPHIRGLPEAPGVALFGNLLQFGDQHPRRTLEWAKKLGPVFQARLGNKRIVYATSFDAIRKLWIANQSALISRPVLHTFHNVVSSSQGFTIGTSPWDESCKRRRKAAATALNRRSVQSYMPIIDLESCVAVRDMLKDIQHVGSEIDPRVYFQRFALNTSLTLGYGIRIDDNVDNELLREVIEVERAISTLRSTSNNWQDYIPILRLFSGRNNRARDVRERRDKYLSHFLGLIRAAMAEGMDKPCITGNVLKDPEAKLSEAEVKSICVTMIAGGLDTVPGNMILGLAYLSSPHGQQIQGKAYRLLQSTYPCGDAWAKCIEEEKVEFITALVKEVLRYWTVLPLSLPRESIRDIEWEDAVIPKGTTFIMNAWAANYDEEQFRNASDFVPERYMNLPEGSGTPHYAYGAGSRACPGFHLANRELYAVLARLILAFEIIEANDEADRPVLDALDCNSVKTSLTTEPRPFKVCLRPRNRELLEQWIAQSEQKTKEI
ncbi:cytochrome P450 [Aspergillus germanicus]